MPEHFFMSYDLWTCCDNGKHGVTLVGNLKPSYLLLKAELQPLSLGPWVQELYGLK